MNPAATSAATVPQCVVLARVAGLHIGVPVAWVAGVVAMGAPLAALPRRQGAVAGLLTTPEGCIPVVDLSRWVDLPEASLSIELQGTDTRPCYLTLRQGSRRLALQVDELLGLRRVPATQCQRLHHRVDPEELFDAVLPAAGPDEPVVCLLEPQRLMHLLALWCEDAAAPVADAPALAAGHTRPARLAIVRTGEQLLAVDMRHVAELMAMPPLKTRLGPNGATAGFAVWRDNTLPVLHAGWTLGVQATARPAPLALVLQDTDGRAVALPVDELLGTEPLPAATAPAAPGSPAWRGSRWTDADQPVELLHVPALLDALPESSLARAPGTRAVDARQRNSRPYFLLQAGRPLALPIDDVLGMVDAQTVSAGQTTLAWREHQLGLHRADAASTTLVAIVEREDGKPAAVRIDKLIGLVPAGAGEISSLPGAPGARMLSLPVQSASYAIASASSLLAA